MANLSITTVCNKRCPYCFAEDARVARAGAGDMTRDCFLEALDFLRRSGMEQVRLLGGEPTLHKDFPWMLETALAGGFKILVFSNGLVAPATLSLMKRVGAERLRVLVNTIHPLENNPTGMARQRETLRALGNAAIAGVNIYSHEQSLDYLVDYVREYGLWSEIRIGIAHPLLARRNRFLPTKLYRDIGEKIADLHAKAARHKIRIGLDCGFVPCMFPADSFKAMEDMLGDAGAACNPIPDLLPDGRFIACYPLESLVVGQPRASGLVPPPGRAREASDQVRSPAKVPLVGEATVDCVREHLRQVLQFTDELGIFPYCGKCPLFKQRCTGGCVAHKLRRLGMHAP
jgi:MoaA/NifB/PqqE/SkfB family radical SAM enzyme